ncbi:MAG: TonB-dependent receptor [Bacteroidales bacterium]|nr:TonB-dependent receptor [Bacteroidales bacterium]
MKFLKHFALLLSVLLSLSAFSQGKGTGKYTVLGTVTDKESSELLPYVSVAVLKTSDSTIIDGGITDDKGKFAIKNLQNGKYILKYSFVGYKDVTKNIEIKNANLTIENVAMETGAENLKEVRVVGAKQMMEYKLDKRVINVDQNLVSSGGNASDVLEDVPSVEVDEEGNVTLRGGSNVTLLIDGKPSSLYGSDVPSVLAQIPASSIDKVEVITNPSAKYNPEGMSGIINITLKEKGNRGLNGNINLSSGMATNKLIPQESISASLNWSNKKFSLTGGINGRYGDRAMITDNVRFMKNNAGYLTDIVRTYRDGGSKSYNIGLNLGAEWYINQLNTLGLTFNTNFRRSPDD